MSFSVFFIVVTSQYLLSLINVFYWRIAASGSTSRRGPSEGEMNQMTTMFPNIPTQIIHSEYMRAGSLPSAIERLLAISSRFPSAAVAQQPITAPSSSTKQTTHKVSFPFVYFC